MPLTNGKPQLTGD